MKKIEDTIKNYEKEIEELFKEWENSANDKIFFKDGIVCPQKWFKNSIRPLFILKEAYSKDNNLPEIIDETEWINGTYNTIIKNQTFKRLIDWSFIIYDKKNDNDYKWDNDIFKNIALMNIKKFDGQCNSDNTDLTKHAKEYSKLIINQIKLINPTIIICGYTRWLLDIVLQIEGKPKIKQKQNVNYIYKTDVFETGKEITVIDFWHPSCRKNSAELNAMLKEIIQKSNQPDWNDNNCVINLKHNEKGFLTKAENSPDN